MLADFQAALADLTASPDLCRDARRDPAILHDRYDLTPREGRRLAAIVASHGMQANCMLYRANRLAPVALNLPDTCAALGDELTRLISGYWESEPTTDVNFLVETARFCDYLQARPDLPAAARAPLAREHAVVEAKLEASRRAPRAWGPTLGSMLAPGP